MRRWSVGARGAPPVQVEARTWLTALGLGLEQLGASEGIERLACEVLRNGTVIGRDIATGGTFLVQPADHVELTPDDDSEELIEVTGEADRSVLIADAADIATACKAALDSARQVVESESGAVLIATGEHLSFAASFGGHENDLEELSVPLGAGIAGYAMTKQRIVVTVSAKDDPRHFSGIDQALGASTRELAAFPLIHDGQALGAIELVNLPEGKRFTRAAVYHVHQLSQRLAARVAALQALGAR